MAAIEINGISKRFGSVQAVSDLSFEVDAGRVTGFGPNGAKSTTFRILLGLVHSDSGAGTFDGRRFEQLPHPSAEVGAVLEDASFHPAGAAATTCASSPPRAATPHPRVDEVLDQVGLSGAAHRRVQGLLDGERQRSRSRRRCSATPRC